MKLPDKIEQFIEEKIESTIMCLPWNYPSLDKFDKFQAGYRYDAVSLENLTGGKGEFKEEWFVVCTNYFDDPFFIDISEVENGFPVYYSQHGAGHWTPIKIAETITEFSNQLKLLKELENNRELLLDKLQNQFDLQNELWKEVYGCVHEEE